MFSPEYPHKSARLCDGGNVGYQARRRKPEKYIYLCIYMYPGLAILSIHPILRMAGLFYMYLEGAEDKVWHLLKLLLEFPM